ncbi:MAG TPA: hypothetical protein VMN60_11545 [Longimicrobiales bacterium]|nr:hypothetical protein [Longimicrobiales bacterium]
MTSQPPHEPTQHVLPAPHDLGRGDEPTPPPPHAIPLPHAAARSFTIDDVLWFACASGDGACGTGSYGLGMVEAVHFFHADAPDVPVREALLARGRFAFLYDAELCALWAGATPIVSPRP